MGDGCLGLLYWLLVLLFRSRLAFWSFGISIIGLIGTTYYERVVADLPESLLTRGHHAFAAAIWIITIGPFFYSRAMRARGVLR